MSEEIANLLELVTAGEWGNNQGTPGGVDTGVIRSANFTKDHQFNTKEIVVRSIEERKRQKKMLQHGDILIEKSGGSPDQPVGRVLFYDLKGEHTCSNFISILRPTQQVDPKFLYYSLCNLYGRGVVKNYQQQTTGIINLQLGEYLRETIYHPPLPEQKKIAEILSGIDQEIQATKKALSRVELAKNASVFNQIDTLSSDEAYLRPVEEVSIRITDGEHQTPPRTSSGIFLLSARNIRDGFISVRNVDYISEETHLNLSRRISPCHDDLLISCSGSIGRCCLVPFGMKFSMVRSVALVRPERSIICPEYLLSAFSSEFVQRQIQSSLSQLAQANLFQGAIKKIVIPVPPKGDQERIGKLFFAGKEQCRYLGQKIEKLELLKQALASDLLSGRKRVSNARILEGVGI